MKHQLTPPYLPFSSFLTALDRLAQAMPTQITRDVFTASGLLKGQIMIALRFFDLVDKDGFPKGNVLERLAMEKGVPSRRANLRRLVLSSYKEVMKFDLTKMSPAQLDTAFQRYQVKGDTKKKAKTFFIKAAQFAELDLSPLLTSTSRTPSGRKQTAPKAGSDGSAAQPSGRREIFRRVFRFSDGVIATLEATGDLTDADVETLVALGEAAKLLKAKSAPSETESEIAKVPSATD